MSANDPCPVASIVALHDPATGWFNGVKSPHATIPPVGMGPPYFTCQVGVKFTCANQQGVGCTLCWASAKSVYDLTGDPQDIGIGTSTLTGDGWYMGICGGGENTVKLDFKTEFLTRDNDFRMEIKFGSHDGITCNPLLTVTNHYTTKSLPSG